MSIIPGFESAAENCIAFAEERDDEMTLLELHRAVRRCRYVFGYVVYSEHDGGYLRLVKADVLATLRDSSCTYKAHMDGDRLYIN